MRLLPILLIVVSCCFAEKKYGFNPIDSLLGNVKSVKETKFGAKKNKDGNVIAGTLPLNEDEKEYRPDGKLTYHKNSRTGIYSIATKFVFDDHGNLISKLGKSSSTGAFTKEAKYTNDANGNCIIEYGYNLEGVLVDSSTFKYLFDATGRIISQIQYNKRGKREESIIDIIYDNYGNRISQTIIDDDNEHEKVLVGLDYNALGLIVGEIEFEDSTPEWRYHFTYTTDGKILEIKKTDPATKKTDDRETFLYSNEGKLIEHIDYTENGSIERKKYSIKFDVLGNWIYMVMMDDDRDFYVYTRDITYYQ